MKRIFERPNPLFLLIHKLIFLKEINELIKSPDIYSESNINVRKIQF